MAGAIGAVGPIIRKTHKYVRYYIKLCALLYKISLATILGCLRYYIRLRTESKQNNVAEISAIFTEISEKFGFIPKFQ